MRTGEEGVKVNKDNLLFFTIKRLWDGGRRKIRNSYHMVHFKLDSRPVKKQLSSDTKPPDQPRGPGPPGASGAPYRKDVEQHRRLE